MPDRPATKEEVAAYQKAVAKCDACAQAIAQSTRQKELADDAIVRETYLKDRYDAALSSLITQLGGTPEPPSTGPDKDKDGNPIPGWHADWIIKA